MTISASNTQVTLSNELPFLVIRDVDGNILLDASTFDGVNANSVGAGVSVSGATAPQIFDPRYTYLWQDGETTDFIDVVAPSNEAPSVLTRSCVVNDGVQDSLSASDSVNVNAIPDTTPPVIALLGSDTVNLNVGGTYVDEGATALDDVDGDLTSSIVIVNPVNTAVAGTYTITYNVQDAASNTAVEVARTVEVTAIPDTTPPVITLLGSDTVNLNVGGTYVDEGATALDDVDGDLTSSIVIVNPVNTAVAGTYTITYNVQDAASNTAVEVARTVEVTAIPNTPPTISIAGDTSGDTSQIFTLVATTNDINVGDTVTVEWTQTQGNANLSATTGDTIDVAPTGAETVIIEARAFDGQLYSTVATHEIEISEPVVNPEILQAIAKAEFVLETDYRIVAYIGRSNIETFKFSVVDPTGLVNQISGLFDFDSNNITKIEILTSLGSISSETGGISFEDDCLFVEFGLIGESGATAPRIVIYVGEDTKGVVITGENMPASPVLFMYDKIEFA